MWYHTTVLSLSTTTRICAQSSSTIAFFNPQGWASSRSNEGEGLLGRISILRKDKWLARGGSIVAECHKDKVLHRGDMWYVHMNTKYEQSLLCMRTTEIFCWPCGSGFVEYIVYSSTLGTQGERSPSCANLTSPNDSREDMPHLVLVCVDKRCTMYLHAIEWTVTIAVSRS